VSQSTTKMEFHPLVLTGREGETFSFHGVALGAGTSQRDSHNHPGDYPNPGQKCSACRWYEVTIYISDDEKFIVHTTGDSKVPGEKRFSRIIETDSAFEVVEILVVRKRDNDPYLPAQAARALAQAAEIDDRIREAYINRAVV
jgi:hypothetical protein